MSGILPTDPKEQELLALRAIVKMDETLIAGLRLRTDRQAAHIQSLERKIKDLEARNNELEGEVRLRIDRQAQHIQALERKIKDSCKSC